MLLRTPVAALVTVAAVLLFTAPVAAQNGASSAPASPGGYTYAVATQGVAADSASAALVHRVRIDLSSLRLAQDAYYAEHHTYAADLAVLRDFHPQSGAVVTIRNVTARGWEASATHSALPGATLRATVTRPVEEAAGGR